MFSRFPSIDLLSLVIGFLLASLFWLLISRVTKLIPKFRETQKHNRELHELHRNRGVDTLIRKQILRRSESTHLAASLFPLKSIYVEIPLISPPISQDPLKDPAEGASIHQIIPFLPETPELLSDLPILTIPLAEALKANRYIAILGELGTGKSTLLAALSTKILEKEVSTAQFSEYLPLMVHYTEIEMDSTKNLDSIQSLLNSAFILRLGIRSDLVRAKISDYARNNRLILLLDGMDELPQDQFQKVVQWINKFQNLYPNNPVIVTAGPYFTAGLEQLGFSCYFIAPLNSELQEKLNQKWETEFKKLPAIGKTQMDSTIDLATKWLTQDIQSPSILHATLETWTYLFSDKCSGSLPTLLEGYLERMTNNVLSMETLIKINIEMTRSNDFCVSKNLLESKFSDFESTKESARVPENPESGKKKKPTSADGSLSLPELIKNGLLVERMKDSYQFFMPVFTCYLLSFTTPHDDKSDWKPLLSSPAEERTLRFSKRTDYISAWVKSDSTPLFMNMIYSSQHIAKLNDPDPLKKTIFHEAVRLLQDNSYPVPLRLRLLPIFSSTDTVSVQQLLDFLSRQSISSSRQIAAFGFGYFQSLPGSSRLEEMVNDNSQDVSRTAFLSLGKIWNARAQKILVDRFLNGDEELRQFIAELFAYHPKEGHEILKEVTTIDNISSRKAAIYGLKLIKEPWVKELLAKISTEDSQWVVKDAALHALETFEDSHPSALEPLASPNVSPWLLQFASRLGLGIPADKFPYELLFQVLASGTQVEQKAAIDFLAAQPNLEVTNKLVALTRTENPLRDHALDALFRLSRKGVQQEVSV